MSIAKGKIIFLSGKMASGMSTFAQVYTSEIDAVVLSEDEFL